MTVSRPAAFVNNNNNESTLAAKGQLQDQQQQQVVYPISVKLEVDSKGYVKPSVHLYSYDADKTVSETVRLFFEVKSQIQERGGKVLEANDYYNNDSRRQKRGSKRGRQPLIIPASAAVVQTLNLLQQQIADTLNDVLSVLMIEARNKVKVIKVSCEEGEELIRILRDQAVSKAVKERDCIYK